MHKTRERGVEHGAHTIRSTLDLYLLQLAGDGRSKHAIDQARRHVRLMVVTLGDLEIDKLRHEDIARFLGSAAVVRRADGKPRKPTSANALRSSLRAFGSFVHAAGYASTNPARLVRRARCAAPRPQGLHDLDIARLLAALDTASTVAEHRDRALFRTMLGLGLRVGSIVNLDVTDLDLDAAMLSVRVLKNSDADTVFLPPDLVTLLRTYVAKRRDGALFPPTNGERMGTRQVARRLELWTARAGIERSCSPHSLRHAFAMAAYARTGDVLLVSRMLLHRSLASSSVYARPTDARVRSAMVSM